MRPLYAAEYCKTVWNVIIRTFLIWSGEKGRRIEECLLVSLIYSLSLFYLVQMKMKLLFFTSQDNFLKKKEAGYERTFQFRLNVSVQGSGKNALGN